MSTAIVRSVLNNVIVQWKRLDESLQRLGEELAGASASLAGTSEGDIASAQLGELKYLRQLCTGPNSAPAKSDGVGQVAILENALFQLSKSPLRPNKRLYPLLNLLRGGFEVDRDGFPKGSAVATSSLPFQFIVSEKLPDEKNFNVDEALKGYIAPTFKLSNGSSPVLLIQQIQASSASPPLGKANVVGSLAVADDIIRAWFDTPAFELAPPGGPAVKATGAFGPNPKDTGGLVHMAASVQIALVRDQLDDLVEFITTQADMIWEIISEEGLRINVNGIREGIEDIGAYPVLTTDIPTSGGGYGGGSQSGGSPTSFLGGGGSLTRMVDTAIRGVLGRTPKTSDTRAFSSALRQSFTVAEVQGRTEVQYQARSFAGQADLGGGVTGAQASLYARASVALDHALPLLDGLTPLDPAADLENADASRAIVRQEMIDIVAGLKSEGGPTSARIDGLLELLFGVPVDLRFSVTGNNPGGHLGDLADTFGLDDSRINTLEEEADYSNFLAVFDFASQIRSGWIEFRNVFQGKDLGTRLVLLSRALSVAAETVDELYAAMDSVFVGPAERQVASFTPPGSTQSVLISELLEWVVDYTTEEAPKLVQDGGRRGVLAIQPTAVKLEQLVRQLLENIDSDPGIPQGLKHARVRFPLRELRSYLEDIQRLADSARRQPRSGNP